RPRPQDARIDRRGRCESLPRLPDALFTSLRGEPGDSGSPLVDGAARIIGLVHGGARCQIATPATRPARLGDRGPGRRALTPAGWGSSGPGAARPADAPPPAPGPAEAAQR